MEIKICPKCKSENINLDIDISASYGAPQKWRCNNCGFESYSYILIKKETKK